MIKSFQQAFNPKIVGSIGSTPKLEGPVYQNNIIVGTSKIHLCPVHIGQVLKLPGADSLDMLLFTSLLITLTAPVVVDTESHSH